MDWFGYVVQKVALAGVIAAVLAAIIALLSKFSVRGLTFLQIWLVAGWAILRGLLLIFSLYFIQIFVLHGGPTGVSGIALLGAIILTGWLVRADLKSAQAKASASG